MTFEGSERSSSKIEAGVKRDLLMALEHPRLKMLEIRQLVHPLEGGQRRDPELQEAARQAILLLEKSDAAEKDVLIAIIQDEFLLRERGSVE